MRKLTYFLFAIGLSASLQAADPAPSNEARLREAVRTLTQQLQTAEADRATVQAAQATLEQKNHALTEQVAALGKQLAADKDFADKTVATLKTKAEQQDAEIARLNESLAKWKTGFETTVALAKKTEAERQKSSAEAATLRNRTADLERKNLALFKLGNEILERYENFGLGRALAAREPFVGTTRVKLENQVQGYKDRLLDPKLKP